MPNPAIAALITERLKTGLMHPGNADDDQPPMPILLPVFRTAGLGKEMAELADKTAVLLAEAIVSLIETEGASVIVNAEEHSRVSSVAAVAGGAVPVASRTVAVHCRCDTARANPLLYLSVKDSPHAIIDGQQFLKGLSRREVECPHTIRM